MGVAAFLVVGSVSLILFIFSVMRLVKAAYISGRREGLRDAVLLADSWAEAAGQLAPRGKLAVGLLRQNAFHTLAMELREAASKVGRQ